jgi:hypothetical protein
VTQVAEEWLASAPGGRLVDVTITSVHRGPRCRGPRRPAGPAALLEALDGAIPAGINVVVDAGVGERVEVGVVGAP